MFKRVKCPTCGKSTHYTLENRYRPFCSERCATLDLGAWAEEKYKVPVNENSNSESNPLEEAPLNERQN